MPVPPQYPTENRIGPATPAVAGASAPPLAADAHAVQFYEDDEFLCAAVCQFLAAGLLAGQPFIVIATHQHRDGIARHLTARGFDVERLQLQGRAAWLDVDETLSTFTRDGRADPELFRGSIGGVLEKVGRRAGATVRVYGEIVDVLCRAGRSEDALRVEKSWNDLTADHSLLLLCGYAMGNFCLESQSAQFEEVCRQHSQVVPTEKYSRTADDGTRLREISVLQQRARALETEIGHRKTLEQELRQALADRARVQAEREDLLALERSARETAETASRIKDEFLAVLSHELRTPLNAILGWTQIANRPGTDANTIQRALDVIQRNASAQQHVIEDLLDVSRIVTGKMVITTDRVDLADVLTAAIETIRPAAAGKSIDLGLDVHSTGRFVSGDAHRLQQVLWNLLSNAVKFTPARGSVEVRLLEADGHARIVIRDTGQGIAPAFLPYVFDRFRQQDSGTCRQYGGLGLGLSVVRYLVEAHGGTVAVESEGEGRGAMFSVTLPLAPDAPVAAGADPDRPVASGYDEYLAKPIDPMLLTQTVTDALKQR